MVGLVEIQLLKVFLEDNNGIPDEEVSEMGSKAIIHATLKKLALDVRVEDQIGIEVFIPQPRVYGDICRVGRISRLRYSSHTFCQGLYPCQ